MQKVKRGELVPSLLRIMTTYPQTVNNANLLCSYFWFEVEGATCLIDIDDCTSAESITRARRMIMEQNLLERTELPKKPSDAEYGSLRAVSY